MIADHDAVESKSGSDKHPFSVGRVRSEELPALARLHHEFFGGPGHGSSLANLGVGFLERVFYRLNLDNPNLVIDVARWDGRVIGFSVYSFNHQGLLGHVVRHHPFRLLWNMAGVALRRPLTLAKQVAGNLSLLTESLPEEVRALPGWYMLLAVKPEYSLLLAARPRQQAQAAGEKPSIAGALVHLMEKTLAERGCASYWAAPFAQNAAANHLFQKTGAQLIARGTVQGMPCNYYRKSIQT